MFNVTIFRIKDIVKYLFCLAIIMIIVYVANRYFFSHKNESKSINLGKMLEEKVDYLIDMQYPQINTFVSAMLISDFINPSKKSL